MCFRGLQCTRIQNLRILPTSQEWHSRGKKVQYCKYKSQHIYQVIFIFLVEAFIFLVENGWYSLHRGTNTSFRKYTHTRGTIRVDCTHWTPQHPLFCFLPFSVVYGCFCEISQIRALAEEIQAIEALVTEWDTNLLEGVFGASHCIVLHMPPSTMVGLSRIRNQGVNRRSNTGRIYRKRRVIE